MKQLGPMPVFRYFAEACATLACQVYGCRERHHGESRPSFDYTITDGLYGSMNCVLYDHATLAARVLNKPAHDQVIKSFPKCPVKCSNRVFAMLGDARFCQRFLSCMLMIHETAEVAQIAAKF